VLADVLLAVLQSLGAAAFGALSLGAAAGLARLRRLPPLPDGEPPPRVSAIVPARNESVRLTATVQRLLAQRGVDLEVIAVDDRSTDATPAILNTLARQHPELVVERIDTLPDGWLGKCHACHVGATRAGGDWLLFIDADSWLQPDVVARAVSAAQREDAAHVTMMASMAQCSLLGRSLVLLLSLGFLQRIAHINRDRGLTHL
jgi:glycosyltransferase involved in cell wall biosynthesis